MNPQFKYAFGSSQGGRRENQDDGAVVSTSFGLLAVVCDGMGGGPGGKTASALAVKTICNHVISGDDEPDKLLLSAVAAANDAVYGESLADPALRGMGTTVAAVLFAKDGAHVVNVGDSRIYQLRYGLISFRSNDHSLVAEAVRRGQLTEEQARLDAGSNVITKALGIKPQVVPSYYFCPYEKGDRFVLCTDGVWGMLKQGELVRRLFKLSPPNEVVPHIISHIDAVGRSEGDHHDNLTLLMVDAKNDSTEKTKMNRKSTIIIIVLAIALILSLVCNLSLSGQLRERTAGDGHVKEQLKPESVQAPADTAKVNANDI